MEEVFSSGETGPMVRSENHWRQKTKTLWSMIFRPCPPHPSSSWKPPPSPPPVSPFTLSSHLADRRAVGVVADEIPFFTGDVGLRTKPSTAPLSLAYRPFHWFSWFHCVFKPMFTFQTNKRIIQFMQYFYIYMVWGYDWVVFVIANYAVSSSYIHICETMQPHGKTQPFSETTKHFAQVPRWQYASASARSKAPGSFGWSDGCVMEGMKQLTPSGTKKS